MRLSVEKQQPFKQPAASAPASDRSSKVRLPISTRTITHPLSTCCTLLTILLHSSVILFIYTVQNCSSLSYCSLNLIHFNVHTIGSCLCRSRLTGRAQRQICRIPCVPQGHGQQSVQSRTISETHASARYHVHFNNYTYFPFIPIYTITQEIHIVMLHSCTVAFLYIIKS